MSEVIKELDQSVFDGYPVYVNFACVDFDGLLKVHLMPLIPDLHGQVKDGGVLRYMMKRKIQDTNH